VTSSRVKKLTGRDGPAPDAGAETNAVAYHCLVEIPFCRLPTLRTTIEIFFVA
jgi:hypothetical protein